MKHIGNQIRNMRKHLKMTQQELADNCEIGINTLRSIENGEGNPTMAVMKRILQTLGLTLDTRIQQPIITGQPTKNVNRSGISSSDLLALLPELPGKEQAECLRKMIVVVDNFRPFAGPTGDFFVELEFMGMVLLNWQMIQDEEDAEELFAIIQSCAVLMNKLSDKNVLEYRITEAQHDLQYKHVKICVTVNG